MSFNLNMKDLPVLGRKAIAALGLPKNTALHIVFPVHITQLSYGKAQVELSVFLIEMS